MSRPTDRKTIMGDISKAKGGCGLIVTGHIHVVSSFTKETRIIKIPFHIK